MDSRTQIRKTEDLHFSCQGVRDKQIPGAFSLFNIIYVGRSRSNKTLCLKRQGGPLLRNDTKVSLWPLHTYMNMSTHAHTWTHKRQPTNLKKVSVILITGKETIFPYTQRTPRNLEENDQQSSRKTGKGHKSKQGLKSEWHSFSHPHSNAN